MTDIPNKITRFPNKEASVERTVFVSSTFEDLAEYRERVRESIRQLGMIDICMENFGARDERPKDECLRLIREESEMFVGIYAHRYGSILEGDEISITESEYSAATLTGLPSFIYLVDKKIPWPPKYIEAGELGEKLQKFKNRLMSNHICKTFSNKDNLAANVVADLGRHIMRQDLKRVSPSPSPQGMPPDKLQQLTVEDWNKLRDGIYKENRNIFLTHVLAPSKYEGQQFDIFIYLTKHKSDDFSEVEHAEFFLGPYWQNQIFYVKNEGKLIGIQASAFGEFLCVCRLVFKDGDTAFLQRYIDFEIAHPPK